MIDPVFSVTLRVALALLFSLAAFHKWSDYARFTATLEQHQVLPQRTVPAASIAIIAIEVLLAIVLVVPALPHAGAVGAAVLLTVYSMAIGINLARGRREIDCGCLGPNARTHLSGWLLVRNGTLIAVALAAALPPTIRTLYWIDAVTVFAATATLVFLWAAGHRLSRTGPAFRRHA